jgi:hypothetical protein
MIKAVNFLTLLTSIGLVGALVVPEAFSQDFPYLVPQAPEFSSSGRMVKSGNSTFRPKSESRPAEPAVRQESYNGSPEPARAPTGVRASREAPKAPTFGRYPSRRTSRKHNQPKTQYPPQAQVQPRSRPHGPTARRRSVVASAQKPAPAQIQRRPDCSQFPMVIANARSQPEMRLAARRYLTCLIQNGWSQDAARKHVISVIETSRLTR